MKKNSTHTTTILLVSVVILSGSLFIYTRGPLSNNRAIEDVAIKTINYTCANATHLQAKYDNSDQANPKAIVTSGDIKERLMMTIVSASGAKYSDGTYVWWTKGNTGFLTEAKDGEKVLVNDCVAN